MMTYLFKGFYLVPPAADHVETTLLEYRNEKKKLKVLVITKIKIIIIPIFTTI